MKVKEVLKVTTGIVVVPIAILAQNLWPWWEKQSIAVKVLSAPLVLPIVGLAALTSFWWNSL